MIVSFGRLEHMFSVLYARCDCAKSVQGTFLFYRRGHIFRRDACCNARKRQVMQEKYLAPWYFAADTSDPKDAFSKLVSARIACFGSFLLVVASYSSDGIEQSQQ